MIAPKTNAERAAEYEGYWTWRRPFLDLCGAVLWVYAVLKVFVADVDRWVFGDLANYRFFAFLLFAVVVVLWFRKTWTTIAAFAYVLGYPVILLCWKIPKWFIKARSFVAFFAFANAATSLFGSIRYSVLTVTLAAFAVLVIFTAHSDVLLGIAGAAIFCLIGAALVRMIRFSFVPSRFLRAQQRLISRFVNSGLARHLTDLGDDLRRPEIEKFNAEQLQLFTSSLGNAVLTYRGVNYWATQLERYRKSFAPVFLNGVGYIWLTVKVVAGLALVNYALYRANPSAFSYQDAPSFVTFVHYAISGLYSNEIAAVTPHSDLANGLSILNWLIGAALLGSFAYSTIQGWRTSKNESEIRDAVDEIRHESEVLERRIHDQYDVNPAEALDRLRQLQYGLSELLVFLSDGRDGRPPS